MPYDPRSVNDGGNRAIDIGSSRSAPKGKFRVVGVDTFDGTDWHEKDFDTKDEAIQHAKMRGGNMLRMYVYDDAGQHVGVSGTF